MTGRPQRRRRQLRRPQGRRGLRIAAEITTDAKVIPTLVSRRAAPAAPTRSRRSASTVARFEGSVAIGASQRRPARPTSSSRCGAAGRRCTSGSPTTRSSWPASRTAWSRRPTRYLRLDGETPADPDNPTASRGQIVVLDGAAAGTLDGHRAGWPTTAPSCPVDDDDAAPRRDHHPRHRPRRLPHFLLKEITEAPASFRKTLRGKLVERDGRLGGVAGRRRRCPTTCATRPAPTARIRRVHRHRPGHRRRRRPEHGRAPSSDGGRRARLAGRRASLATELSGFGAAPRHDRHARGRHQPVGHDHRHQPHRRPRPGPRRRGDRHRQPAQQRPHRQGRRRALHVRRPRRRDERRVDQGLLRPDRGRLPAGLRHRRRASASTPTDRRAERARRALRDAARRRWTRRIARRAEIAAEAAQRFAPSRRYWAIVGNGANRIAAQEMRIKLSELCYKSIACDSTEDKKHIDLSSEPLILVCAAGLVGSNGRRRGQGGGDLPGPQGGADRHRHRGRGALLAPRCRSSRCRRPTRSWPSCCRPWSGHLFGYEAALAIDAQAHAAARGAGAIERRVVGRSRMRRRRPARPSCRRLLEPVAATGSSTGCAAAPTTGTSKPAPRSRLVVAAPLRHRRAARSSRTRSSSARSARPSVVVEDLTAALTSAIEELTRPVDAIKHQAKTVTVGISRSDEGAAAGRRWCAAVAGRRRARDRLSYRGAAHARRPRPRGRRGASASPATASRAPRRPTDATDRRRSTGAASRRDLPLPHRARTPLLRGTKHRVAARARGHGRPWAAATGARCSSCPR